MEFHLGQRTKSSLHTPILTKVYNFSPSSLFSNMSVQVYLFSLGHTKWIATSKMPGHSSLSIPLPGHSSRKSLWSLLLWGSLLFILLPSGLIHLFLPCPRSNFISSWKKKKSRSINRYVPTFVSNPLNFALILVLFLLLCELVKRKITLILPRNSKRERNI